MKKILRMLFVGILLFFSLIFLFKANNLSAVITTSDIGEYPNPGNVILEKDDVAKTFTVYATVDGAKIDKAKFKAKIIDDNMNGYTINFEYKDGKKVLLPDDSRGLFYTFIDSTNFKNNFIINFPNNFFTSNVISMKGMFEYATSANPDVSNWDTSKVIDMSEMFNEATSANPDVSRWDTSKVTNMYAVFASATSANPDVSKWDTSKVTNMSWIFFEATSANPDISNWDMSNVIDINTMFARSTSVNPDMSTWNIRPDVKTKYGYNYSFLYNSGLSHTNYAALVWLLINNNRIKNENSNNPNFVNKLDKLETNFFDNLETKMTNSGFSTTYINSVKTFITNKDLIGFIKHFRNDGNNKDMYITYDLTNDKYNIEFDDKNKLADHSNSSIHKVCYWDINEFEGVDYVKSSKENNSTASQGIIHYIKDIKEDNEYYLTYDYNDGVRAPIKKIVKQGEALFNAGSRKEYTFGGWYDGPTLITSQTFDFTEDKVFKAKWAPKTYTVTYDYNGGSGSVTSQNIVYDQNITLPIPNQMTGYNFGGWYLDNNTFLNKVEDGIWKITKDVTLYAKWDAKKYKITYNHNGGSGDLELEVTYDKPFILKDSIRNGYNFKGWYTDITLNNPITNGTWATDSNLQIYAKWEVETYNITYELNGGNVLGNPPTYTVEDTITLKTPTKTGHKFIGWTGTGLLDKTINVTFNNEIGNRNYVANFEKLEYDVTFNTVGGNPINPKKVKYQELITGITNPTRPQHTFKHWTVNNTQIDLSTYKVEDNVELVAVWEIDPNGSPIIPITPPANPNGNYFTVQFELDGGIYNGNIHISQIKVDENTILHLKDIKPTKTGYTFDGWYDGTTKVDNDYEVTKNVTLKAKYNPNTYTITYVLNGGTGDTTQEVTYGKYTYLKTPTKLGYELEGWYKENTFTTRVSNSNWNIANDITLYAKWIPTKYTIRYYLNDGINNPDNPSEYTIEDTINLKHPTKDGYVFIGWTGTDLSDKTLDVTFTNKTGYRYYHANWELKKYTVKFDTDGGSLLDDLKIVENKTIDKMPISIKDGYKLIGWLDASNEITFPYKVTNDITLKAKWEKLPEPPQTTFTITFNLDGGKIGKHTTLDSITKEKGYIINSFSNPVKNGYIFEKWVDSSNTEITFPLTIEKDLDLTAIYKKDTKSTSKKDNNKDTKKETIKKIILPAVIVLQTINIIVLIVLITKKD